MQHHPGVAAGAPVQPSHVHLPTPSAAAAAAAAASAAPSSSATVAAAAAAAASGMGVPGTGVQGVASMVHSTAAMPAVAAQHQQQQLQQLQQQQQQQQQTPASAAPKRARAAAPRAQSKAKRGADGSDDLRRRPSEMTARALAVHPCSINDMAAPPSMRHVFTAGEDGLVRKFDLFPILNRPSLLSKAERDQFGLPATVERAAHCATSFSPSPHGKPPCSVTSLVVDDDFVWGISGQANGALMMWSVRGDEFGTHLFELPFHRSAVYTMSLNVRREHSDDVFMAGDAAGNVSLWDLNSGTLMQSYSSHRDVITLLQSSPRSSGVFLTASMDGDMRLFDVNLPASASRSVLRVQPAVHAGILSGTWVSETSVLIGRMDGYLDEVDVRMGKIVCRMQNNVPIAQPGVFMQPRTAPVAVRNVTAMKFVQPFVFSADTSGVHCWQPATGTTVDFVRVHQPLLSRAFHSGTVSAICVDKDLQFMATASGRRFFPTGVTDNMMLLHTLIPVSSKP